MFCMCEPKLPLHTTVCSCLSDVLLVGTLGLRGLGEIKHVTVVVLWELAQEGRDVVNVLEVVRNLLVLLNLLHTNSHETSKGKKSAERYIPR